MKREEIFQILDDIARGVAMTFGRNCETLIQDYGQANHPVLSIYNGHVSGREIGSNEEITEGASTYVPGVQITDHFINCFALRNGRKIKTTSFNFKGPDYYFCFGINFDFTAFSDVQNILEDMNRVGESLNAAVEQNVLMQIFEEAVREIGVPVDKMKRKDRINLVGLLQEKNAFTFKKSVPFVAERLNISRYTVYSYIKELEK